MVVRPGLPFSPSKPGSPTNTSVFALESCRTAWIMKYRCVGSWSYLFDHQYQGALADQGSLAVPWGHQVQEGPWVPEARLDQEDQEIQADFDIWYSYSFGCSATIKASPLGYLTIKRFQSCVKNTEKHIIKLSLLILTLKNLSADLPNVIVRNFTCLGENVIILVTFRYSIIMETIINGRVVSTIYSTHTDLPSGPGGPGSPVLPVSPRGPGGPDWPGGPGRPRWPSWPFRPGSPVVPFWQKYHPNISIFTQQIMLNWHTLIITFS